MPTIRKMQYFIGSIASLSGLSKMYAKVMSRGDVMFLEGPVGAGKSTFVKYVLEALGLDYLGSPTFGLVNRYISDNGLEIIHADLYRNKDGILQELMDSHDCVIMVEWGSMEDRLVSLFPRHMRLTFGCENMVRTCTWERYE